MTKPPEIMFRKAALILMALVSLTFANANASSAVVVSSNGYYAERVSSDHLKFLSRASRKDEEAPNLISISRRASRSCPDNNGSDASLVQIPSVCGHQALAKTPSEGTTQHADISLDRLACHACGATPGLSPRTATPAIQVQHEDHRNDLDGNVLQKTRVLAGQPQRKLPHVLQLHQISYFQCRITQGAIEAINGIIQLAKRRARGFRNFVYLRVIAYWVAGQLKANLPSYLPT